MSDMRIAVMGAGGRMGRELVRAVHALDGCVVAGGVEQPGSPFLGQDVGALAGIGEVGAAILDDPLEVCTKVEAILDFTSPKATLVATTDRRDSMAHAGFGVRAYLTHRFVLRSEYKAYVVFTSRDDNEEIREWKTGFSFFF